MVNKDFLKAVLNDEKRLLTMNECKVINVPKFDELSVKNIYPLFKKDQSFMVYFPDVFPKDRWPHREYFFTVLNTVYPEYLAKLITHANKMRFASDQN